MNLFLHNEFTRLHILDTGCRSYDLHTTSCIFSKISRKLIQSRKWFTKYPTN